VIYLRLEELMKGCLINKRVPFSLFLSGEEVLRLFFSLTSGVCLLSLNGELGSLLIELHEFSEIELGLLEELDLSDEDVLKREDLSAFLLNLLANSVSSPKRYN
jgi:hypothetical protein